MPDVPTEGLWVSLSDLAKLRGVDKGGLSRRVARLKERGHLTTRTGERGAMLINVAEFDRAAAETVDGVRAINGGGSLGAASAAPATTSTDPVLVKEQARRAAYDADLKYLDLQERLGILVPIDDLQAVTTECATRMVRAFDRLPSKLDEMMAACREGPAGGRRFLRDLGIELRTVIATNLSVMPTAFEDRKPRGQADIEIPPEKLTAVP